MDKKFMKELKSNDSISAFITVDNKIVLSFLQANGKEGSVILDIKELDEFIEELKGL